MALRSLLEKAIDYAGLFPPAELPLAEATRLYEHYRQSPESWLLGRFVIPAAKLSELRQDFRLSVVANGTVADDPRVDSVEARTPTVESIRSMRAAAPSRTMFCEIPLGRIELLDTLAGLRAHAKIRMGGESLPTAAAVAAFVRRAADLRVPWKATAGLHHPIRGETTQGETMHGFVNVLLAAAFAAQGMNEADLSLLLEERDPSAFRFDDKAAHWRGQSLSYLQIRMARLTAMHSFGSCSFDEPVADLKTLGWL